MIMGHLSLKPAAESQTNTANSWEPDGPGPYYINHLSDLWQNIFEFKKLRMHMFDDFSTFAEAIKLWYVRQSG